MKRNTITFWLALSSTVFTFVILPMVFGGISYLSYMFGIFIGGFLIGILPQITQFLEKKVLFNKAVANMKEPTTLLDLETLGKST